jgi:hypothetical protein
MERPLKRVTDNHLQLTFWNKEFMMVASLSTSHSGQSLNIITPHKHRAGRKSLQSGEIRLAYGEELRNLGRIHFSLLSLILPVAERPSRECR